MAFDRNLSRLIQEKTWLVLRKFRGGLTPERTARLAVVFRRLDGIESADPVMCAALDRLEEIVVAHEELAATVTAAVNSFTPERTALP